MNRTVSALLSAAAVCSLGMVGCSTTSTGGSSPNTVGGYWGGPSRVESAPAPKAAPAPAKAEATKAAPAPAPAPAPVASGNCPPACR